MARKADLRPSPLSATLSPDLLTLQASFHVNYLPDILSTFRGLLDGAEVEEFEVEKTVKPAVLLDGQLARQNSRVILLEAARRAAFKSNNLYFSSLKSLTPVNSEALKTFHHETLERASIKNQQYSLLLSVNDRKLIDLKEFSEVVSSCDIKINSTAGVESNKLINTLESRGINLESDYSEWNEFLLAFPIPEGGFNQNNSEVTSILESLLKRVFPSTEATVTSDTSLLSLYFKFDSLLPAQEIKGKLQTIIKELSEFPQKIKDEDITWAKERSKFNQALALDSRDNRLLLFAHRFAFTGRLLPSTISASPAAKPEELKEILKSLMKSGPIVIGRGNYKKLFNYNELF